MVMEKRIGGDFDNVSQRLVYNYVATQPGYRSIPSEVASETAQRQFYDWIGGIYSALYHDPTLIGMTTDPDETEDRPNPHRAYKDETRKYLEARKLRRENETKIEGLFDSLQRLGELGAVRDGALVVEKDALGLNKRAYNTLVRNLAALGLSCVDAGATLSLSSPAYPDLCAAWKLLAAIGAAEADALDARWRQEVGDGAALAQWQIFSHARELVQTKSRILKRALFDPAHDYALDLLQGLCDDPAAYRQFVDLLLAQGFQLRTDWGHGLDATNAVNVAFAKTYAGPEGEPLRLQFITQFDSRYYRQMLYTFIEDKVAVKTLLRHLDALPEPLQDLVYGFTGECKACGFCNQTNRKLPFNNIPTVYRGKPVEMCYYFKYLSTRELTGEMIEGAQALYAWFDSRYEVAAGVPAIGRIGLP